MGMLFNVLTWKDPIIEAHAQYVADTQRGTSLQNGVTIQTSEHVLAALVGCEVDNVLSN